MERLARRLLPLLLALPLCAAGQTVSLNAGGEQLRIAVGTAAALPADFPADVALPRPHVLTRLERSQARMTVELDTPGDPGTVAAALQARMRADGWREAPVSQPGSGIARAWEKDARAVVAWASPGAAGVRLQLQLQPRR